MSARLKVQYENHSSKFLVRAFDYQKQFSHLYAHRLAEMSSLLERRAREKWGQEFPLKKLRDLREENSQETCIIVGTIYKHQAHKPSILREISEENQLAPQPPREHYSDPDTDKIILEDDMQRLRLFGKVDVGRMATGAVCAVLGRVEEDGRFDVEELLYYEGGPQRPLKERAEGTVAKLLVIISGIDQVNSHEHVDALNLFQHWLGGNINTKSGEMEQAVRLVVAGNSVRCDAEKRTCALQTQSDYNDFSNSDGTVEAMRALDECFAAWSRSIYVDVMPGAYDPANFMLPQQPFHRCMFPRASQNTSFTSVTNPYSFVLDELSIVGCSGQNIRDILRCSSIEDPLEALRCTLIWSHLAPTAPDTLACYPYIDSDPFILRECPHIYFAGNCDAFATALHESSTAQRTRLICVPSFARTQSVAVVNLETLECHQVCFNVVSD